MGRPSLRAPFSWGIIFKVVKKRRWSAKKVSCHDTCEAKRSKFFYSKELNQNIKSFAFSHKGSVLKLEKWSADLGLVRQTLGKNCGSTAKNQTNFRSEEHTSELPSPCNLV